MLLLLNLSLIIYNIFSESGLLTELSKESSSSADFEILSFSCFFTEDSLIIKVRLI